MRLTPSRLAPVSAVSPLPPRHTVRAPVTAPAAAVYEPPQQVPPHLQEDRRRYEAEVRQMQSINRFQRKRAVADQLLLPVRSAFAFVPIPFLSDLWLGLGARVGIPGAHVNSHEGRDPTRLRKHLFEPITSRRQSVKIVRKLASMGVITDAYRYARPLRDAELSTLQTQFRLSDEAVWKIRWAIEIFSTITAETEHRVPTRWDAAALRR